jgi:hypothetical protein
MPNERLIPSESEEIKKHLGDSVAKAIEKYFEDTNTTVSRAQMEAFARVVSALPDGKFKELVGKLEGPQKITSKVNEAINRAQDESWKIVKPFVALSAPMVMAIPKEPFRKLAIKSLRLGGFLGEKVVKTTVEQSENIKNKVRNFKNRKRSDGV